MLRSIKKLLGYHVEATDGPIGKVADFYFDDQLWKIRYLVVDTGGWLSGRRVLLAPVALGQPDWKQQRFPVLLTREQVENSPESGSHPPVSLQHQIELHRYYAWPLYWGGYDVAGPAGMGIPTFPEGPPPPDASREEGDPHLRSAKDTQGYRLQARDGEIGHVDDFIVVDDANWEFRYVVVDTRNWLPGGRKVLISPAWIDGIGWPESNMSVDLTREGVRNSPEFHADELIDREYESSLFRHHERLPYWEKPERQAPGKTAATPAPQPASKTDIESGGPEKRSPKKEPGGGGRMLHPITMMLGRELHASDGPAGKIEDVYFEEGGWRIRYLVVNAGNWANSRRLLIAAGAIPPGGWSRENRVVSVRLTKDQLRGSPDFGNSVPARDQERKLHDYYGWRLEGISQNTPLLSLRKAIGFHLQASDGEIGHVDNFIFDDSDWSLRYAQIDTSNLPGGKSVLLATEWLTGIDWDNKKILVDIPRNAIRNSPEYHPDKLNRDYESRLYEYHRRPGYWRAA